MSPSRAERVPPAPGAAGGKARSPSLAHPAPQPPPSRLQREASARTEVIFHLRKPSPTSSPSFRSPQLPNQRGPDSALPRRPERSVRSRPGPGPCGVAVPQPNAAGRRVLAPRALCAHRGLGRSRSWAPRPRAHRRPGKGVGRPHFRPGRGVSRAPLSPRLGLGEGSSKDRWNQDGAGPCCWVQSKGTRAGQPSTAASSQLSPQPRGLWLCEDGLGTGLLAVVVLGVTRKAGQQHDRVKCAGRMMSRSWACGPGQSRWSLLKGA